MATNEDKIIDAAVYAYMRMVAERFEPGTLREVLDALPAEQRAALEEAADRAQARLEQDDYDCSRCGFPHTGVCNPNA